LKVQLYFWRDCPSHPEADALLESIIAERSLDVQIDRIEVRTEEDAVRLSFPGSPTIRIDGRDVDPVSAAARPALTCRIYRLADGRASPVPTRQHIEEALDAVSD
jgi:hypothetical protein